MADKLADMTKRLKMPALKRRVRNIDRIRIGVLVLDSASNKNAQKSERHVDIENPAPADGVDQETTKRRAGKEPNVKCRGSETQRLPPFLARQSHRNNRPAVGRNHRPADGLNGSEEDELA